EELAKENNYQALSKGLIERLEWAPDSKPEDFLQGKRTRPGHVAADLDVPRPTWVHRIEEVFQTTPVCILRSSSGQGKSTILYVTRSSLGRPKTRTSSAACGQMKN